MVSEKIVKVEEFLKGAFKEGYANAAQALSILIKDNINFEDCHIGSIILDSGDLSWNPYPGKGTNVLLTTEIFGDLTGKSYLFISEEEYEVLTGSIPCSKDPGVNLKEEFIKELDNILTASVTTKLANALCQKMYGDVPVLVGKIRSKVENIIYDDFIEQTEKVYINAICFHLENHPTIHPFFVWAIDCDVLEQLRTNA